MDEKNLEKNLEKKSQFFDLEKILSPDESINFYSQNLPSAGKLNRMLLAGYYALRWIDEKIDNVTQFMENILAVRNEAERIIGLPEKTETSKKIECEKVFGDHAKKINPADLYTDKICVNCEETNAKKYYEIPYINVNKEKEQRLYASDYICEECARKFSMIDVLSNIYDYDQIRILTFSEIRETPEKTDYEIP